MHLTKHTIARNLSDYIKNNPDEFNDCISRLINKFTMWLNFDIPEHEITKLCIVYRFIFMYSIITADLNIVKRIMVNPNILATIIKALITDGNLKLRQNSLLVDIMLHFGQKHKKDLASHNIITLASIYFNATGFYNAICWCVADLDCYNSEWSI